MINMILSTLIGLFLIIIFAGTIIKLIGIILMIAGAGLFMAEPIYLHWAGLGLIIIGYIIAKG